MASPPPSASRRRAGGGDGILLDDVIAGLYGLAVMVLARTLFLEPQNWVVG